MNDTYDDDLWLVSDHYEIDDEAWASYPVQRLIETRQPTTQTSWATAHPSVDMCMKSGGVYAREHSIAHIPYACQRWECEKCFERRRGKLFNNFMNVAPTSLYVTTVASTTRRDALIRTIRKGRGQYLWLAVNGDDPRRRRIVVISSSRPGKMYRPGRLHRNDTLGLIETCLDYGLRGPEARAMGWSQGWSPESPEPQGWRRLRSLKQGQRQDVIRVMAELHSRWRKRHPELEEWKPYVGPDANPDKPSFLNLPEDMTEQMIVNLVRWAVWRVTNLSTGKTPVQG